MGKLTKSWLAPMALVFIATKALVGCGDDGGGGSAVRGPDVFTTEPSVPWYWLSASSPARVEGPIAVDPVIEMPAEPVWREFWLPIQNEERERAPSVSMTRVMVDARPGMSIADIGAGGGYWAFQWASLVGPTGFVYAIDIDLRMTRKLSFERGARGVSNMEVVQVPVGDLSLRPSSVDVVTFLGIGAFVACSPEHNAGYFRQAWEALRPGGRLVITDGIHIEPAPGQRECSRLLRPDELIEMARSTFRLVRRDVEYKGGGYGSYGLLFERLP